MQYEKSCGAVIYKVVNNKYYFLIEHMGLGHNSMCKGHVEEKETEYETALREIKEETNLDVKFIQGFKEIITYSPYPNITKDVIYFLATPIKEAKLIDLHDDEVTSSNFYPYNEALNLLTYESDKEVLNKAYRFLERMN